MGLGLFVARMLLSGIAGGQELLNPPVPLPTREAPNGLANRDSTLIVKLGHGRVLTLKDDLFAGPNPKDQPSIAVGDPGILDFRPISSKQIRLIGVRAGSTDLAVTTADGRTTTYEVEVVPDLVLLSGQLRQTFPDASLKLGHIGGQLVVEGQARNVAQVKQIIGVLEAYSASGSGGRADASPLPTAQPAPADPSTNPNTFSQPVGDPASGGGAPPASSRVLNLIRVPGSQQVLLKVRIAELNRTAMRQIGANTLAIDKRNGAIFGTQIGSPVIGNGSISSISQSSNSPDRLARQLLGTATTPLTAPNTLFGIFQNSNFELFINALRDNSFLKVLAEPNVLALSGHQAQFLAGGQFPVPSPPSSGNGAVPAVQFKDFGVTLNFLPVVLDDGVVRLTVDPEVSSIDQTISTTIVPGGSPVPGIATRRAHTTVELRQGQTLAIAGLLQLTLNGDTRRIPGLGDLPVLGPFFSNTTSNRIEKELIVLVTPYLVEPLEREQVPPGPGDEVNGPNDLEFYLLNRIEGRTGRDHRATTQGADPLRIGRLIHLERKHVRGPVGFSD